MSAIRGRFRVQWPAFTLDAAFEAPARGVTALFGPSGSGKTTLLRCIAGLEHARGGHLSVDGETWQDGGAGRFVPTHRRPLGYVFQEASLFPHLSVRRNLEYGWRRTPPAARLVPFDHAVGLLGLEGLLERDPARLSGGERQRAAIARALLAGPRLLLMDEPLANLDAAAKAEILPYLQRVRDALSIPMLYVSHALDEVLALADHMLLLRAGRVAAAGPLAEVLAGSEFAALRDPELGSVLPATVLDHDEAYHLTRLRTAGGDLRVPRLDLTAGAHARVRILARDVSLALEPPTHTSILNTLAARVLSLTPHGPAQALVRLDVGGAPMLALVTRYSADRLKLAPGMAVHAQVKTVALLAGEGVLPAAGG